MREFLQTDGSDDEFTIAVETRWNWIRDCWLDASGRESGRTAILFENGTGESLDLNTGNESEADFWFK